MGLERFEVAMRPCVDGRTLSPVTLTTLPLPPATGDVTELVQLSQRRYGVDRTDVEAALRARTAADNPSGSAGRQYRGGRS
jgi:hypothetical protein